MLDNLFTEKRQQERSQTHPFFLNGSLRLLLLPSTEGAYLIKRFLIPICQPNFPFPVSDPSRHALFHQTVQKNHPSHRRGNACDTPLLPVLSFFHLQLSNRLRLDNHENQPLSHLRYFCQVLQAVFNFFHYKRINRNLPLSRHEAILSRHMSFFIK